MSSAAVVIGALRVKVTGTVSGEVTLLLAHLYVSSKSYCYPFEVGISMGVGVTLQSFMSKLFM